MKQLREGLAGNLAAVTDVQVNAYALAAPTPPGIQILAGANTPHQAMQNGLDIQMFTVQAFVGFTTDIGSQILLDEFYRGPRSIQAAVESDPTLGGVAQAVMVTEISGAAVRETAAGALLVAEWSVQVYP